MKSFARLVKRMSSVNKVRLSIGIVLLFVLLGLSACTPAELPSASTTSVSTPMNEDQITAEEIAAPARTSAPTKTLASTATSPLEPTNTPIPPTPTEEPTATVSPTARPATNLEECFSAELPESACTGVSSNKQWEPVIREFNQIEMVLVPVGCFQMGNKDGFPEEQPVHQICFDEPFWIDLTEVTVAQFANFLNRQPEPVDSLSGWLDINGHVNNEYRYQLFQKDVIWYPRYQEDNIPLGRVTWIGANDYCNWRDARLPTEAEWEYAARGPENYLYPWGNELDMDNFFIGRGPEVGSFPEGASWVGALDMAAGLFEWTSSLYKPYPYQPDDGREVSFDVDSTGFRVFRGSPWYHSFQEFDNISSTARFEGFTDYGYWYHGFRCARSID